MVGRGRVRAGGRGWEEEVRAGAQADTTHVTLCSPAPVPAPVPAPGRIGAWARVGPTRGSCSLWIAVLWTNVFESGFGGQSSLALAAFAQP